MTPQPQRFVHVDASGMEMNRSGTIAGKIHLEILGATFPAEGWWDFPVVILKWWLDSLRNLGEAPGAVAELLFMDGPHQVRLESSGNQLLRAALISRSLEQASADLPRDRLDLDLRRAATEVLQVCTEREWDTDDVRALRSALGAQR